MWEAVLSVSLSFTSTSLFPHISGSKYTPLFEKSTKHQKKYFVTEKLIVLRLMLPYATVFPFPDDYVPLEKKLQEDNMAQIAKAIYSRWFNGFTLHGWADVGKFMVLEQYAEARQNEAQYLRKYHGKGSKNQQGNSAQSGGPGTGDEEFKEKGYVNLNPRINSTAPKHIATIHSRLKEADQMIDVESLNPYAVDERKVSKLRAFHTQTTGNKLRESVGLPKIDTGFNIQSRSELEIFERYHGWKVPLDTALIMGAKHTANLSHWDQQFEDHVDAFLQTGCAATKICYNRQGGVYIKYIHPGDLICQYFKKQKQMEPVYAGHIEQVRIFEIEKQLIEAGATESELRALAKSWALYFNNAQTPYAFDYNVKDPTTGRFLWKEFIVLIFHFEYMTVDRKFYRKYKKSDGTLKYEEDKSVEYNDKEGKYVPKGNPNTIKRDEYTKNLILEGSWVVGSRFLIDHGVQTNSIIKNDGSLALSYTIENVPGKPVVESWIPDIDGMQMAYLKLEAAVLAASPKGLAIDLGLLANMVLGDGIPSNPLEIVRIRREAGTQFYQSTAEMLNRGISGKSAIGELDGGIGPQQEEWINQIRFHDIQMMDKAGITQAASASPTENPDLVGLAQMQSIATDNALYRIKKGLINLKGNSFTKALTKIRISIDGDKECEKYYRKVLGDYFVDILLIYKGMTFDEIGIKMRPFPNKERKMLIMQAAQEAIRAGSMAPDAILVIEKLLEEGYIEYAAAYLTIERVKTEERKAEVDRMLSAENARNQEMAGRSVAEAKAMANKAVEDAKKDREMSTTALQGEIDERLKQLQAGLDAMLLRIEGEEERKKQVEISGKL